MGHFAITVGALLLGICSADATTRALVVGVSGYPNLAESLRLVGPKNDSRAFANTLAGLGIEPANITVLADGAEGLDAGIANSGPATRDAVLAGLDRLVEESGPGDLAVFYFSGHGSQQPDRDGDEQGGNDEIFLPYDVGKWDGAGVERALVDDELNARISRILDKGADFFGIVDACNSATGFRALAGDDIRSRGVDPGDLGVPAGGGAVAARPLGDRAAHRPGRGRAALFYAAQEVEEALEKVPKDAAAGESYGVFTYTLLGRLNASPGLTYRTLHRAVVADIKKNTLMATQTPELEGQLLDEPVLRLSDAAPDRLWPIFNGKLQGGALDGLAAGALLALYDDPAADRAQPIAHGLIEAAGATRSTVVPSAGTCDTAGPCVADEAAFRKARFARLVEPGVDFGLVLSEPVRVDPADGRDYAAAVEALRAALAGEAISGRVRMRPEGADVTVGLIDGTLAFAPAGGLIDRNGPGSSPRVTLPADPAAARVKVADSLDRMARATALQRLAGGADAAGRLGLTTAILARTSPRRPASGEGCPDIEEGYADPVPAGGDPVFSDCDILTIRMTNDGRKPLDVTVLLVGADFSITPVWPVDGNANRIHIGEERTVDILQMEPDPKAASEERLVVLALPGVNRAHVAFTDLGQDGLRQATADFRPGESAVRALLDAGLNDFQRSTASLPAAIEEELSVDIRPFLVTGGGG